jgi:hypothetical protein
METMTYYDVWSMRRERRLARKFERANLRETRKSLIKAARQCESIDKLYAADFIFRCDDESPRFSPFD